MKQQHRCSRLTPSLTMKFAVPWPAGGGCVLGGGALPGLVGLVEVASSALKTKRRKVHYTETQTYTVNCRGRSQPGDSPQESHQSSRLDFLSRDGTSCLQTGLPVSRWDFLSQGGTSCPKAGLPVPFWAAEGRYSLVSLRPLPAAQSEAPQQLVAAQEDKRSQSQQRKDEEEEDEEAVPERRVLICGRHIESAWSGDVAGHMDCTVPCGSAVHAAAVARQLAGWRSPAVVAVAVPVAVTHLVGTQVQIRLGHMTRFASQAGTNPCLKSDPPRLTPCPWHFVSTSQS